MVGGGFEGEKEAEEGLWLEHDGEVEVLERPCGRPSATDAKGEYGQRSRDE